MVATAVRVSESKAGHSALSFLKTKRTILNLQTCVTKTSSLTYKTGFFFVVQIYKGGLTSFAFG
jgi:hypothetical protein